MMKRHICALLLFVLVSPVAQADEGKPLRNNPFSRPPSEPVYTSPTGLNDDGSARPIDLRATMVSGRYGLANVNGKILRPGQGIHGFTLLKVFEDRAIFSTNGKQLTIYVKIDRAENDE